MRGWVRVSAIRAYIADGRRQTPTVCADCRHGVARERHADGQYFHRGGGPWRYCQASHELERLAKLEALIDA